MTDRELLELAFSIYAPGENYIRMVNTAGRDYWNPLENDGQAQRLAVKLRLNVFHTRTSVYVVSEDNDIEISERHERDPDAATCRAIVRVAAAMAQIV